VELPVLWCTHCSTTQLVHHIFARTGTSELLCLSCAQRAAASGHRVSPLSPDAPGWVDGADPPVPTEDAIRLLLRLLLDLGARQIT
jgi:hypothetical protein